MWYSTNLWARLRFTSMYVCTHASSTATPDAAPLMAGEGGSSNGLGGGPSPAGAFFFRSRGTALRSTRLARQRHYATPPPQTAGRLARRSDLDTVSLVPAAGGPMNPEVEAAYKAVLSDALPTSWRVRPRFASPVKLLTFCPSQAPGVRRTERHAGRESHRRRRPRAGHRRLPRRPGTRTTAAESTLPLCRSSRNSPVRPPPSSRSSTRGLGSYAPTAAATASG